MVKVEFAKDRETKRTWRYQEVKSDADEELIGTLYIKKFALENAFGRTPERLTVTIGEPQE